MGGGVFAQPRDQVVELELVGGVEVEDEVDHLLVVDRQIQPVHPKECVSGGEGRALVAVKEWVVLGKAFPQCGCSSMRSA